MLSGMRKASKNWLGRTVMSLIMGLLIISFGLFGISSWLGSTTQSALATVGTSEISFETYRSAFAKELENLTRVYRRQITSEQAKAAGIDQQILNRMMTDLTLDEQVKRSDLHISDDFIVKKLIANPAFRTKDGQLDRARLSDIASRNGLSDTGFVKAQGAMTLRQQLVETVSGGIEAPKSLTDAMNRQNNEQRAISFFRLAPANLSTQPMPDDSKLLEYYNRYKSKFRAPEFRKIVLINLGLADFTDDLTVSEEDLNLAYEDGVAAGTFGKLEQRSFEQIVFNDAAEANIVSDKIKSGTSFEAILKERDLKVEDVTLKSQTKAAIIDKDVAEAAFATKKGAISQPIAGVFGFTIIHMLDIEPSNILPMEQVRSILELDAKERKIKFSTEARTKLDAAHDSVEDLRSSGKSLAEIASALNFKLKTIESLNQSGTDKNDALVSVIEPKTTIPALFNAAIGADTEVIRTKDGGYMWFEIANIEPEHERRFEDVKIGVGAAWLEDEINREMVSLAQETFKNLNDGVSLADGAKIFKVKLETKSKITRSTSLFEEAQPVTTLLIQIFSTPVNSYGMGSFDRSPDRIIFKVTDAYIPSREAENAETKTLNSKLNALYADDIVNQYVKASQIELGAKVNQRLLNSATGAN